MDGIWEVIENCLLYFACLAAKLAHVYFQHLRIKESLERQHKQPFLAFDIVFFGMTNVLLVINVINFYKGLPKFQYHDIDFKFGLIFYSMIWLLDLMAGTSRFFCLSTHSTVIMMFITHFVCNTIWDTWIEPIPSNDSEKKKTGVKSNVDDSEKKKTGVKSNVDKTQNQPVTRQPSKTKPSIKIDNPRSPFIYSENIDSDLLLEN